MPQERLAGRFRYLLPLDEAKTPPARLRYPFVRQLKRVVSFNGRAMREVWGELGWSFTPNYPHPA
jgi:hypothetical protein